LAGLLGLLCAFAYAGLRSTDTEHPPIFSARDSFGALRARPVLTRIALAQGFYGGGLIAAVPLYAIVNVDRLNLSLSDVGIIGILTAGSTTLSFLAWGAVADRRGPLVAMRLGSALGLAALVAYALAPHVTVLWVAAIAAGAGSASIDVGVASIVSDHTPLTSRAAAMAGIRCFATGGIGGVHRGHPEDQSADLVELGRSPVAVFCAGAKIILDIGLTLERLESLSVPVLGYGCDELPAFYARRSGHPVGLRVDGPDETAAVLGAAWGTGSRGVVVAIPPPGELDGAEEIVMRAVRELGDVSGPDVTPRLLARVAELSGGRSLDLNVDLVVNNARVAARVASCLVASA
jgi:hypothetical protein